MKKTVIGIDIGGSTTKIVGFQFEQNKKPLLIAPQVVKATDPVTSMYGAFGKFTEAGEEETDVADLLACWYIQEFIDDVL